MRRSVSPLRFLSVALPLALFACAPPAPPPPAEAPEPEDETVEVPPPEPGERAALPSDAERARGVSALADLRQAREAGDRQAAERALREAREAVPILNDWIAVLGAEVAAEAGDAERVAALLDPLEEDLAWEWGWTFRERALAEAGDRERALRVAEEAAGRLDSPVRRARAHLRVAEHREALGQRGAALDAYRAAMDIAPQADAAVTAARTLSDRGIDDPADHRRVGEVYLRHNNLPRAESGIGAFLASGRATAAEEADLRYRLGRAQFAAGRNANAEENLLAVARSNAAEAGNRAEALLFAARSQYRDGRQDAARERFLSVPERHPGTRAAAHALYIVADLDHDAGRLDSARSLYRRAVETGVDSDEAVLSATRLAGLDLLAGRPREAAAPAERFLRGSPSDARAAQALYWLGRARLEAGDEGSAREAFREVRSRSPLSYYAVRAGERLGGEGIPVPAGSAPTLAGGAADRVERGLVRVDILREAGLNPEATYEIARVRESVGGDAAALYPLAHEAIGSGRHVEGILLGREIQRAVGSWTRELMQIVWPFPYRELIERYSARHDLDPFLVAGLIRQESMFNQNAVSPAGAVGLMQVMPATGRDLARAEGISGFTTEMLRDPEINIRLGTRFLADQMQRHGGRLTDVFAAYNAGPTRMARWRNFPEHADEEIFAERIPFEETRNYVKILRFNRELYRTIYGE